MLQLALTDRAMIVLTHAAPDSASLVESVLPVTHNSVAPASARRDARKIFTQWGLSEDTIHDALVVVSELLTNSLQHAQPPFSVHLEALPGDGEIEVSIEVTDGGPAPRRSILFETWIPEEHGRGLAIVEALTTRRGSRTRANATTSWAVVGSP
jgi:anti-sigma regulatory factor (Ser/Thr protein kinase)